MVKRAKKMDGGEEKNVEEGETKRERMRECGRLKEMQSKTKIASGRERSRGENESERVRDGWVKG